MGSFGHMPGITPDHDPRPDPHAECWRTIDLAMEERDEARDSARRAGDLAIRTAERLTEVERELAEAGEVILALGARAHQAEQERDEARDLWARDIAQAETTIYLIEQERDGYKALAEGYQADIGTLCAAITEHGMAHGWEPEITDPEPKDKGLRLLAAVVRLRAERDELAAWKAEALAALRWYADPASYQDGCPGDLAGSHQTRRWQPDGGEVARRALSRLTPDASSRSPRP